MYGFDWTTHQGDLVAANADLDLTGLVPPALDALRDRFDLVESLSGWRLNDKLYGDSLTTADRTDADGTHVLDATGIARVEGMQDLLGAGVTSYDAGNILIGGAGSDLIEGRGGDDIIDGDKWYSVSLRAPDLSTTDPTDTRLFGAMNQLQADVFAGRISGDDISIARQILPAPAGDTGVDTAVFTGARAEYDVVRTGGTVTVTHVGGTAVDGTDTVRGVETLRFTDQDVDINQRAPDAPTIGTATRGNASATVRWTAGGNGGSPITEFQVQVFDGGTAPVRTVTGVAANATTVLVNGLTNGTTYTFRVVAVNEVGASAASAASNAVTPVALATTPVIGTASAGDSQATVNWSPSASDGGSPITGYQVRVASGRVQVGALRPAGPGATSLVVTGLTNGTAYRFQVRANNAAGSTPFSAQSNIVTPGVVPGAAVIGTATSGAVGGDLTATARWTPPGAAGSSAVNGYRVTALEMSADGTTVLNRTSIVLGPLARARSFTLAAGTYRFEVEVRNSTGFGPASARSNAVVAR